MKKRLYILVFLLLISTWVHAQNNTVCDLNLQVAVGAAGPVNRTITVMGNSNCSHFCVDISASDPVSYTLKKQGRVMNGVFYMSVEIPKTICGKINVQVRCGSDLKRVCDQYTCSDQRSVFIPCNSTGCPKITEFKASSTKQCSEITNGQQPIFFSAIVSNPDNVQVYIWTFGDGTQTNTTTPFASHTYQCPHAAPPYEAMLTILCKSDVSQLDNKPLQVLLRSCTCPIGKDDQIVFTQDLKDKCRGLFEINLTGTCPGAATQVVLDFGDGSIPNLMPMPSDGKIRVNHTYECLKEYNVELRFEGLSGEAGLCRLNKKIKPEGCKPCLTDQPNEGEVINPDGGSSGGDDDCFSCQFCGGEWWCCLLFVLFVLFLISTAILLMRALCPGSTGYDWAAFIISLVLLIGVAAVWASLCDVNLCMLFGGTAFASWTGWSLICDSNIVPCNTWLCGMATIPGTGVQVTRLWIARILLTVLALIVCALGL